MEKRRVRYTLYLIAQVHIKFGRRTFDRSNEAGQ